MYCQKCGRELPDGAVFCNYCGTKQNVIEDIETSSNDSISFDQEANDQTKNQIIETTAIKVVDSTMNENNTEGLNKDTATKENNTKKLWAGIIVGVVALLAIGLIVYSIMGKSSDEPDNASQNNNSTQATDDYRDSTSDDNDVEKGDDDTVEDSDTEEEKTTQPESLISILATMEKQQKESMERIQKQYIALDSAINSADDYRNNKNKVEEWYTMCDQEANGFYGQISKDCREYYKGIVKEIGLDDYDAWDTAMNSCYEKWDKLMDDYYSSLDELYENVYEMLDEALYDADEWEDMYDAYDNAWEDMYDAYDNAWEDMYDAHDKVWDEFYDGNQNVDAILQ